MRRKRKGKIRGKHIYRHTDTFDDLTLTDSHTSGIAIDSSGSGNYANNDAGRLGRSSNTTESITYHYTNITGFTARVFWYPNDSVRFYASADGSTWRQVDITRRPRRVQIRKQCRRHGSATGASRFMRLPHTPAAPVSVGRMQAINLDI